MNKLIKIISFFFLVIHMTGCSNINGEEYAASYVQSILDSMYYNDYETYQEITLSSDSEIEERYQAGIDYEVEAFFYNWSILYPIDDMYEEVSNLYKEIYLNASYQVNDATKISSTEYEITVDVQPMDIFIQVIEEMSEYVDVLTEKYDQYDYETMSYEEYEEICIAYDYEWANAIISCYQDKIDSIGYESTVSITVTVSVESNIYVLSSNELMEIDAYIIQY